ncbi:MAG: hypothetical protein HYU51_05485 [Candidatus Rokubacteria bacterium]|nr:hypothetical protein [Candidatus Rokubacteria bacterium]
MRSDRWWRLLIIGGTLIATAGCATSEEWQTWNEHPAHFASGTHMGFSVRNREGTSARVTRQDIATSRTEAWWGKPITVSQEQILER